MRTELLSKLRELGVVTVNASYSGYGDSGQVEHLETIPPVPLNMMLSEVPHPWKPEETMTRNLDYALRELVWTLAYNNSPGFENNEGGQGEVVWDITTDKILLDHSYNVSESISEPTVEL
jgi:hypothetical protein